MHVICSSGVHAFQPSMQLPHQSQPQYAPALAMQPAFQITGELNETFLECTNDNDCDCY